VDSVLTRNALITGTEAHDLASNRHCNDFTGFQYISE